jgi:hypothetical protein
VEQWSSGAVEQSSSGAVEQWSSGAVEQRSSAPSGAQIFSISNGGVAISHRDNVSMLSETSVGADEVQNQILHNSSGFST